MSWQEYVDGNLIGTGHITKAVILGQSGGVWANSAGFTLSDVEQTNIAAGFQDPSNLQATGIRAAGIKYMTIRADDRSIYGKSSTGGIICVKTVQAILVAEYESPTVAGDATKTVEDLADYLISVSY